MTNILEEFIKNKIFLFKIKATALSSLNTNLTSSTYNISQSSTSKSVNSTPPGSFILVLGMALNHYLKNKVTNISLFLNLSIETVYFEIF